MPRNSPCSLPSRRPFVLRERRDVGVPHPGLHLGEQPAEDFVLHARRLADGDDLLGALDGLEPVDRFRHVDNGGRRKIMFDPGDELVRQRPAARDADGLVVASLDVGYHQLGLVLVRVGDRGEGRRGEDFPNPAMDLVVAAELSLSAARPHVDDRHPVVGMKHHGLRIPIGRRMIGQPLGVAAQPVIVALHDEGADAVVRHRGADRRPAAVEFRIGHRIEQSFVHFLRPFGWSGLRRHGRRGTNR